MKKLFTSLFLISLALFGMAQCLPPTSSAYLDVNNVRARINLGGSSWWDQQSVAQYEVPVGSGKHSFYAESLWIGGKDDANQLHLAAMRYGQNGEDYWPGPISNNGSASIEDCLANDRVYKLNRWEVAEFRERFDEVGYVIPTDILEWPAVGNPYALADAKAPFFDVYGDGTYDPYQGDYPAFAFGEPINKDYHLLGDQCLWWVENDKGGIHTESGGEQLGIELKCMAYAFASCGPLHDQTFYRYTIINHSTNNYHDTYIGLWVDSDLGFANDDYVQCDVMRHLGYTYNGFAMDGSGGPNHYGAHPPAAGIGILEGPFANGNDGVDNDRDGTIDETDEHLMMSKFLIPNDIGAPVHYYNYLQGLWIDGSAGCYGGTGYPNSGCTSVDADFVFPGNSDPLGYGTSGVPQPVWTEQTVGNPPGDRRFLISCGPFDFTLGEIAIFHYAALWARDTNDINDPFSSAEALVLVKDYCQDKFDGEFNDLDCCPPNAQINYTHIGGFDYLVSSTEEGTSYSWDFGDGTTSSERFPEAHHYPDYGIYTVCLTVENLCGSSTTCQSVTITPAPLGVRLKRIEGSGNMARTLQFVEGMHDSLFVSSQNRIYHPVYDFNHGPIRVEIVDPTLVPAFQMMVELTGVDPAAGWKMYPVGGNDTIFSNTPIGIGVEQLIPQWGMLVQVKQVDDFEGDCAYILDCSIEQSANPWLTWLHDTENAYNYSNWIRSGTLENSNWNSQSDYGGDLEECFEHILDGTWAPYKQASHADSMASPTWNKFKSLNDLDNLHSVDVVITADQSKWTRCAVLEIADVHVQAINDQQRFNLRLSPSVDKNGNPDGSGTMGMSWFPGYAVNLETGERLNMAFGENSWLQADNGADMIWNPTSTVETVTEDPIMGGGHYIYVFGHNGFETNDDVPLYDEGEFIFTKLSENNYQPGDPAKRRVFKDAMWVSIPLLEEGHQILESDVKIKLRVRKPYVDYQCLDDIVNQTHPLYSFNTINTGTGINDGVLNSTDLLMYPNPTSGILLFESTGKLKIESIQVFDHTGKLVLDRPFTFGSNTAVQVDVSGLAFGLYLAVIQTDKGKVSKKLVVN